MQHSNFVHLHLHTQWSLLDGAIRPSELVSLVKEMKMPAVAVTDHGSLFGAIEFYQKAMSAGVKPIIGCEAYVAPASRTDRTPPSRGGSQEASFHFVLLVKNAKGYQNLCKLLSSAWLEGFYYRPRVDKELLKQHNEGLIALSACLHGEVSYWASMGQMDNALKAASEYREIFPDRRFYLEIQHNGIEEQEKVNRALIEIGKKLDIPLVATNDCHYLKKTDSRIHDVLLCIQTGVTVKEPNRMRFSTDEFYVKSPQEMSEAFKDTPEALANTVEIAERCNFDLKLGEHHLPEFPVPEGETLDSIIELKARAGLEKRLNAMPSSQEVPESSILHYHERLQKELKVIRGMGFSGYFLIVNDFIEYARSKDIPVGPGRGSAAGSLVAYSLGITNLDPIRYNLLFERFLNPDRVSLPDIDIDFCFEKRDEVIKYVTGKYGSDNVTQIITFGQMKARAVIRDVGRALDMPYGEVDRIAKLVPALLNITIEGALEQEPRLKKMADEDPRVKELLDIARALEGLPRHASTHAAGVVISNKPLTDYLPLYKGQKENIVTTQFSMKDVEKIGLVKFDFLGLKTLTVIDKTVKLVKKNRNESIDIDTIPLDVPRTYEQIASGNTNGIFQLESSGMKDLLRKLKPETFEDLIAAVALYRPGPLQSGMVEDFINRKHKKVSMHYEVPELKEILENTYGVMVYQEQVMEIAKVLSGFTPGDADVLRKAMGKKLPEEMLVQKTKFMDGAMKRKIPVKKAEKIFDLMAKFAGYGFNKSHSAAYALIAYQTAYLKAHYPVEFMAALLSSDMDSTDQVVKYINECRDMGLTVAPPDLNKGVKEFTVDEGVIRYGLAAVKNVGSSAIDEILLKREEGPFASMLDFLSRVDSRKLNRKVVESLIKCGAFDFTQTPRAALFASLDSMMDEAEGIQRDRSNGQQSIFEMLSGGGGGIGGGVGGVGGGVGARGGPIALSPQETRPLAKPPGLSGAEWPEKEKLAYEKETLGFYFSSHPLTGLKDEIPLYTTSTIGALSELSNNDEVTVAGVVAGLKEIMTKKGDRMAFVRLEDMTGSVETVVFSDLYRKHSELISSGSPVLVSGRLDKEEEEGVKLIASDFTSFDEARASKKTVRAKNTHIFVKAAGLTPERLSLLKKTLGECPGTSRVFIHIVYPDGRDVVLSLPDELSINPAEETYSRISALFEGIEAKTL